jgi:small subunit ribosomal protein S17
MINNATTGSGPAAAAPPRAQRLRRKVFVGVVTSAAMQKTIVVRIPRLVPHREYGKYIRRFTVCKAHDEKREAAVGDTVRIMETRPLSKTKRWRLVEIVARGRRGMEAKTSDAETGTAPAAASAPETGAPPLPR